MANCFNYAVGVADPGIILNSQMSASSYYPYYGRLNGNRGDGWCAERRTGTTDWLQIDLGRTTEVC